MSTPAEDPADDRLCKSIVASLSKAIPLRSIKTEQLIAEVRGGVVTLRGYVGVDTSKYIILALVRSVPGVKRVVNELATDEDLERQIALSLANRTANPRFRLVVNVSRGIAALYGALPSREEVEAAVAIAASVPGVQAVENRVHVLPPGQSLVLAWQGSLEGRQLAVSEPPPATGNSESPDKTAAPEMPGPTILAKEKPA